MLLHARFSRPRVTRSPATRGASLVEVIVLIGVVALLAMAGFRHFGRDMVSEVDRERQHVAALDPTTGGGSGGPGGNCTGDICTNGINCFVAGTLVTTANGLRPIETIAAGDIVLSKDEASGRVVLAPVVRTFVTPDSPLVEVALGEEAPLRVTSAHLFWTADRGWIEAQHLVAGEPLVTADGRGAEVVSVARIDARATVYNFEVQSTHTYFVGRESIWVHNAQSSCTTPFNGDPEGALPPSVNFGPSVRRRPPKARPRTAASCRFTFRGARINRSRSSSSPIRRAARGTPKITARGVSKSPLRNRAKHRTTTAFTSPGRRTPFTSPSSPTRRRAPFNSAGREA